MLLQVKLERETKVLQFDVIKISRLATVTQFCNVVKWDRLSSTVYVILLNIDQSLPHQKCSSHFVRPGGEQKMHSLALALTLTSAPTLIFNHLASELLQATTMLYAFNLRQRSSATGHNIIGSCQVQGKSCITSYYVHCACVVQNTSQLSCIRGCIVRWKVCMVVRSCCDLMVRAQCTGQGQSQRQEMNFISDEHRCLALLAQLEPGPKSGDTRWADMMCNVM